MEMRTLELPGADFSAALHSYSQGGVVSLLVCGVPMFRWAEDDYADTQLAETFLHHPVMVVPIATEGHVHAVVTRSEFFQALYDRVADIAEDYGD